MTTLPDFPMVSQLSKTTSDGKLPEDALFSCVPASIGAAILYYQGKSQWDSEINPDHLKDMAYPGEYTGATAARAYVEVCEHLGYKLWALDGEPGYLVQQVHAHLQKGVSVLLTIPDVYVPASYQWSHVVVAYGESTGEITFMDPFVAHSMTKADSELAGMLQFGQVWPIERIEDMPMVIDLNNPEVANFYSAGPGNGQWTCKIADAKGKHYTIGGEILATYCRWGNAGLCGLSYLGLPLSDEIPLGNGRVKQHFQNGVVIYDPAHTIDSRPGLPGAVYPLNIYGKYGEDPLIAQLEAQIATMQKQQVSPVPPAIVADMQQVKAISGKY